MLTWCASKLLKHFGHNLCHRYGNEKVARWIIAYAWMFRTPGAAVLYPEAPWFNTYDPYAEDDCVNDSCNQNPSGYFDDRGWTPKLPGWVIWLRNSWLARKVFA